MKIYKQLHGTLAGKHILQMCDNKGFLRFCSDADKKKIAKLNIYNPTSVANVKDYMRNDSDLCKIAIFIAARSVKKVNATMVNTIVKELELCLV